MSESKATQNYQAFDSIRQRFGEATQQSPSHKWSGDKPKRRSDSRAAASTLVPLVEEGDQIQEDIAGATDTNPPYSYAVKGKWKYSSQLRSNHLNGPDFDALETASTASYSSAYSSKSDSSALTGTLDSFSPINGSRDGSFTELLSDAGSCDTFLEYDIKSHQSRTAQLRASFEGKLTSSDAKYGDSHEHDSPDDYVVKVKAKAWNKVIGEWIFPGIQQLNSPSQTRGEFRRPSNEIRVPTPLSTPLFGSTENLFDSGSHSSLLSSNCDGSEASEDCYWSPDRQYKLGKFLVKTPSTKTRHYSSSSLTSESYRMSDSRDRKISDSCLPENTYLEYDADGLTPQNDDNIEFPNMKQTANQMQTQQRKWVKPEIKLSLHSDDLDPPCDDYSTKVAEKWLKAFSKQNTDTPTQQQDNKAVQNNTTQQQDNKAAQNNTAPLQDNEASQSNNTVNEKPTETPKKMAEPKPQRPEEEPMYSSIVQQRASVFGGTKRGLRRTQSFQVGPRSHGNNSPLADKRRRPVIVNRKTIHFV